MKKTFIIGVVLAVALIGTGFAVARRGNAPGDAGAGADAGNVVIIDGTQIVTIRAKGGYKPKLSSAKAGMPTVIRFHTDGNFDCSSSVRIPSLQISKTLPGTGTTDIAVGELSPGVLRGTCGMGMYDFAVDVRG